MQTPAPEGGAPAAPAQPVPQDGAVAAPAPSVAGGDAGPALAAVAVALILFVVLIYFVSRWRIGGRIAVGSARSGRQTGEQDFFQPAGEGAEITFEDEPAETAPIDILESETPAAPSRRRSLFGRDKGAPANSRREIKSVAPPAEVAQDDFDSGDGAVVIVEGPPAMAASELAVEQATAPRRGVFSGLFGRRKSRSAEAVPVETAEGETTVEILHEEPEPTAPSGEPARPDFLREERAPRPAADWRDRHDEERRSLEDREAEARRAAAEDDLRRDMERRRAEREAEFERRKVAASLEQRQLEFEARERALLSRERALALEAESLREEAARVSAAQHAAPLEREAARITAVGNAKPATEGIEALSIHLDEHRHAVTAAIQALAGRIEAIAGRDEDLRGLREDMLSLKRALGGRNARPAAPIVHLADIMRNALPPDAYEMRASLGENRRADCLVRLPRPAGPIAIDARFPVEAFAALHAAPDGDARAENEFRRVALKHLADVAERIIVPGATGDSAIMFLPSETMCSELHARFPDIVEDGYRARVWIVSPTGLMATLNAIRAVMRDAPRGGAETGMASGRLLGEIEELRRRVAALEGGRPSAGPPEPKAADAQTRAPARPEPQPEAAMRRETPGERPAPPAATGEPDLWEDRRGAEPARQPFPLR